MRPTKPAPNKISEIQHGTWPAAKYKTIASTGMTAVNAGRLFFKFAMTANPCHADKTAAKKSSTCFRLSPESTIL